MPAKGTQLSKGIEARRGGGDIWKTIWSPRAVSVGDLGDCLHYQVSSDHSTTPGAGKAEAPKGVTASGNKQGEEPAQVQESGSGGREVLQICSASSRDAGTLAWLAPD